MPQVYRMMRRHAACVASVAPTGRWASLDRLPASRTRRALVTIRASGHAACPPDSRHNGCREPGGRHAAEDKLHRDGGDPEAEQLLGDQHALFVERGAQPIGPVEDRPVEGENGPEANDRPRQVSQRLGLGL